MKTSAFLLGAGMFLSAFLPLAAPTALAAPALPFVSKKDGYSIVLPGKPTAQTRPMPMPGSGRKTLDFIKLSRPPLTYVVIPMKLPGAPQGANLNRFLDGVQRGFTMSTAAKLLSSRKISLSGAPGREILVQVGQNLMRGRFFVKGNRSYQVVAISPKNGEGKYRGAVLGVLDSFRILN